MSRPGPRSKEKPASPDPRDRRYWIGPPWFRFYRNADNPRLFVRKWRPTHGWTLNYGHPMARIVIALVIAAIVVGVLLAVTTGSHG